MTRPPRVPPADWSPRDSGGVQEGNLDAEALVARMLELRGIQGEAQDAFFHPDRTTCTTAADARHGASGGPADAGPRRGERIMAYGDYDVDGATVALIQEFLENNGFDVVPYIPDRYSEGYGLSEEGPLRPRGVSSSPSI